jgi:hypothetical protein
MWSAPGFLAPCRLRIAVPAGHASEYRRPPIPSRAEGDSGGRSLVFTHGRALSRKAGRPASRRRQLAAYLRRSASRGGKARAKVLTAEERHERARQTAEARWARRKPR